MTYKAIIFDLDNTLFDFDAAECHGLGLVYQAHFADHVPLQAYHDGFHQINRGLWGQVSDGKISASDLGERRWRDVINHLGVDVQFSQVRQDYQQALANHIDWIDGAQEAVEQLKQHFKLGVITNGLGEVQEKKCDKACIDRWSSSTIISGVFGIAKPDVRIFEHAFAELQVSAKEALMVGDSLTSDYQGALNVGMDFCWINPQGADLPAEYPEPKFTVKTVAELPGLL